MNAEILCIGSELLHGDIVNTNARYISKKLAEIAIDVHYQTVVGDNAERIKNAFDICFSRADIVICTGGLGPTQDDITKEALAEYFGVEMVFDQGSYEHVKNIYMRFRRDFPQNNMRQAFFPSIFSPQVIFHHHIKLILQRSLAFLFAGYGVGIPYYYIIFNHKSFSCLFHPSTSFENHTEQPCYK
jgi:molybdenum cofactor synthesis domain-containing protein